MTFIQARNYTKGRIRPLRLIVWHDMEAPEGPLTAENVAQYFATTTVRASAHTNADSNSHVESVKDTDTAYAAPGANADGYHVELAGYARQSRAQWLDAYSKATIDQGARQAAVIMRKYAIPARWLTDAEVADGKTKGMTTHAQVSRVFKTAGGHTDPGAGFPADYALERVKAHLGVTGKVAVAVKTVVKKATPKPVARVVVPKYPGVSRLGSTGTRVRQLQAKLASRGWRITVDGDFGLKTEAVVKAFQKRKGLKSDGVVGPKTHAAIYGP